MTISNSIRKCRPCLTAAGFPCRSRCSALDRPAAYLGERDKLLAVLAPQGEPDAAQAFQESQPADLFQFWMIAQDFLQPVIGYPAVHVMDMMDADIGREPAQHARQIVIGTAGQ